MSAAAEPLPLRVQLLRRFNPAICWLLQSPLHGLASRRLLALSYRGKRSGKQYTIPLVYVIHEGETYCVTRTTQWWKSVVSAPSVTIWLRGEQQTVVGEEGAPEDARTQAAFRTFLKQNPGTASLLYNVSAADSGELNAADLHREIHNSHVIRFRRRSS